MPIAIGVDIGGSHISSAAVHIDTNQIIPGTYFNGYVNSKASKEVIFKNWANVINRTLERVNNEEVLGVGIAMPGPFQYKTGIAMFEGNDKYEALFNVSVAREFPEYINMENVSLRFLNDASSFGIGGALIEKTANNLKIIAITLGTGFGATFLKNHIPVISDADVPEGGCLWNKAFRDGMADDYFSTRWFLSEYQKISGQNGITEVKEIVAAESSDTLQVFDKFALNMCEFLLPHLKKFDADLLVLGGNISKSHHLFLPSIIQKWKDEKYDISVAVIENTEEASIIGSSYLFEEDFWKKVKHELPEI